MPLLYPISPYFVVPVSLFLYVLVTLPPLLKLTKFRVCAYVHVYRLDWRWRLNELQNWVSGICLQLQGIWQSCLTWRECDIDFMLGHLARTVRHLGILLKMKRNVAYMSLLHWVLFRGVRILVVIACEGKGISCLWNALLIRGKVNIDESCGHYRDMKSGLDADMHQYHALYFTKYLI